MAGPHGIVCYLIFFGLVLSTRDILWMLDIFVS